MSIGETISVRPPGIVDLAETGELTRRVERAREILHDCVLCGRQCRVDRIKSLKGASCRTGARAKVDGFRIDRDIEPFLIGAGGAGVVEYSFCNLRCRTCKTWRVKQRGDGAERSAEEIARGMLDLQHQGADLLILRRPSHVIAQSLDALAIAVEGGLRLPIAYDSGGYDHPTGLALLDGVVDLYLVDIKSGNSGAGRQLTRVRDYGAKNRHAILEMHRQVGDLEIDADGRARRGLLVRHAVLPNGLGHSGPVLRFVAEEVSRNTAVHLIGDFEPVYQAEDLPMLRRSLKSEEFDRARGLARRYGLRRLVPATI